MWIEVEFRYNDIKKCKPWGFKTPWEARIFSNFPYQRLRMRGVVMGARELERAPEIIAAKNIGRRMILQIIVMKYTCYGDLNYLPLNENTAFVQTFLIEKPIQIPFCLSYQKWTLFTNTWKYGKNWNKIFNGFLPLSAIAQSWESKVLK